MKLKLKFCLSILTRSVRHTEDAEKIIHTKKFFFKKIYNSEKENYDKFMLVSEFTHKRLPQIELHSAFDLKIKEKLHSSIKEVKSKQKNFLGTKTPTEKAP